MVEKSTEVARLHRDEPLAKKQRISTSVRKVSRQCRDQILSSHGYHALWLGELTVARYTQLLRAHYIVRQSLEALFDSLGGVFVVRNQSTQEEKLFVMDRYVTLQRKRADSLRADLEELAGPAIHAEPLPAKTQEVIDYMKRVKDVYSAGLLGVLYMLEETLTYAGPRIARNLERQLGSTKATRYLRSTANRKSDLWEFRKSLDLISDFQTQVNIVTAANIAYALYRDLIDPTSAFPALHSKRLH
jgi:hypothetical protein